MTAAAAAAAAADAWAITTIRRRRLQLQRNPELVSEYDLNADGSLPGYDDEEEEEEGEEGGGAELLGGGGGDDDGFEALSADAMSLLCALAAVRRSPRQVANAP